MDLSSASKRTLTTLPTPALGTGSGEIMNESEMRDRFDGFFTASASAKNRNSTVMTREQLQGKIDRLRMLTGQDDVKKDQSDYHLLRAFDVKGKKLVRKGTRVEYVPLEEVFGVIHRAHISKNHGCRDILRDWMRQRYANITQEQICMYLSLCPICQSKKRTGGSRRYARASAQAAVDTSSSSSTTSVSGISASAPLPSINSNQRGAAKSNPSTQAPTLCGPPSKQGATKHPRTTSSRSILAHSASSLAGLTPSTHTHSNASLTLPSSNASNMRHSPSIALGRLAQAGGINVSSISSSSSLAQANNAGGGGLVVTYQVGGTGQTSAGSPAQPGSAGISAPMALVKPGASKGSDSPPPIKMPRTNIHSASNTTSASNTKKEFPDQLSGGVTRKDLGETGSSITTNAGGAANMSSTSSANLGHHQQVVQQHAHQVHGGHQSSPSLAQTKYAQLLAVLEELGKDVRPTYTGNRMSAERMKRSIISARMLVRDCLMETEKSARA